MLRCAQHARWSLTVGPFDGPCVGSCLLVERVVLNALDCPPGISGFTRYGKPFRHDQSSVRAFRKASAWLFCFISLTSTAVIMQTTARFTISAETRTQVCRWINS